MKNIKIEKEDIDLANKMSSSMGALNNSITKGRGNVIGFLGEIIVAKELGITLDNTYDYDLIFNNKKIDVKSKKAKLGLFMNHDCINLSPSRGMRSIKVLYNFNDIRKFII